MPEHTTPVHTELAERPHLIERRACVRYPCDRESWCCPVSAYSEVSRSGRVYNLSASGIGLLLDCRFEPETVLEVKLSRADGSCPRMVRTRVLHSTRRGAGREWLVGCAFARALSDDELQAILT